MALWHLFGTKQKGCHRFAMRLPPECYQIAQTIQYHLPHLRESQSLGLTLWVYGTIVMGSACQNAVSTALSFMGSFDTIAPVSQTVVVRRSAQAQTDSDTDRTWSRASLRC